MERKNSEEDSLSAGHNLPRIVYQEGVNSVQIPFLIKLKGENLCALLESRFSFTQEQIRGLAITISPEIKEVREEFQEKLILGETALRRNPQGIRETTLYAGSLARFHAGQKSEVAEMDSEQIILARTQRLFSLTLLHEARHAYDLDLIEQEEKKLKKTQKRALSAVGTRLARLAANLALLILNRKIIGSMGSGAYTFILDRRLKKSPEFQDLENRAQEETNNITPEWTEIIEITKNPTF